MNIEKTLFFERGNRTDPKIILNAGGGDFVIAGSLKRNAWATKVDSDGNVKWRYISSLDEKVPKILPNGKKPYFSDKTHDYDTAAIMADGSILLFGKFDFFRSYIITHLDKNGKLLKEELVPYKKNNRFFARVSSSFAWQDGVVTLGSIINGYKIAEGNFKNECYYWIMFFDKDGNLKWEKFEPMHERLVEAPNYIRNLQDFGNGEITFVATRNGAATEIVKIKKNGDIVKNLFDNESLTVLLETKEDKNIYLISQSTEELTKITLDQNLQEISRIKESHENGVAYKSYILPDKSLLLFGDMKDNLRRTYPSITMFSPDLKNKEIINVASTTKSKSFWVNDAIPIKNAEEFVSVRTIEPNWDFDDTPEELYHKNRLGFALDFIKINNKNNK